MKSSKVHNKLKSDDNGVTASASINKDNSKNDAKTQSTEPVAKSSAIGQLARQQQQQSSAFATTSTKSLPINTAIATMSTSTTQPNLSPASDANSSQGSPQIIHRHRLSSFSNRNRPQSMLSTRVLMFDEPTTSQPSTSERHDSLQMIDQHSNKSLTPPTFRKEHFSGSGGLFKSASAVSVGKEFNNSFMHPRKTSYQLHHSFRSSNHSSRNDISNMIRMRNSALGKSEPSLSPIAVCQFFIVIC